MISINEPLLEVILKVSSPPYPYKVSLPPNPLKASPPAPPINVSSLEVPLSVCESIDIELKSNAVSAVALIPSTIARYSPVEVIETSVSFKLLPLP